jgi:hypothetical protein
MYKGEVNVEQEQLASFLNTAELLEVQGLTNSGKDVDKSKKTAEEVMFEHAKLEPRRDFKFLIRPRLLPSWRTSLRRSLPPHTKLLSALMMNLLKPHLHLPEREGGRRQIEQKKSRFP